MLTKAVSIWPSKNARRKLSKLSQSFGGASTWPWLNSVPVLNDAMTMTTSGTSAIRQATISDEVGRAGLRPVAGTVVARHQISSACSSGTTRRWIHVTARISTSRITAIAEASPTWL